MATFPNPLTPRAVQRLVDERPLESAIRKNYIGEKFLPMKPVYEYELTWDSIVNEAGLGGLYALQGRPQPGQDKLFRQHFAKLQHIMSSRVMDQFSVLVLREAGEVAVQSNVQRAIRSKAIEALRDRVAWCDDRVDAVVEYLRIHALQGQIVWPPVDNDGAAISETIPEWGAASIVLDFSLRAGFNQDASTLSCGGVDGGQVTWDDASATIADDILLINDYITDTLGISAHGATVICSSALLSYMTKNTQILGRLAGLQQALTFLDLETLKNWAKTNLGWNFVPYDAQWTYRSNADSTSGPTINYVRYLPKGRLIIIPPGEDLGYFATAPAPGPEDAYNTGKYTWLAKNSRPPFDTEVGEGLIGFPIFRRADSIFILDALT